MKRILSMFLTVAMLASMLAMAVSAYDQDLYDSITTENQMSFKVTNKATGEETLTFKAGDEINITSHMDSIWGDPDLEDDVKGYEGNVLPGAHGMAGFTGAIVFPLDVFTPKAATDIKSLNSTINNAGIDPTTDEKYNLNATKTALSDSKKKGFYSVLTESATFNGDEDRYAFFTGSGDLATYKLVVNEDAKPGTYKLPFGAFTPTNYETGADEGLAPKYEFFGNWYADVGHSDSQGNVREDVRFVSPTGEYVNNDQYQGAYITITIEGDITEEDKVAAAEVDALIDAIGTDIWAAGSGVKVDAINTNNNYLHFAAVPGTSKLNIKFKMIPVAGGDTFGYIGGTTDANGGSDNIYWNAFEKKFVIGTVDSWVNASAKGNVKAESAVLDLPEKEWTDVEYIYDGSYMAVKVNGVIVVSTNNASTGYSFYIFYPSLAIVYVKDMVVTWDGGSDNGMSYLTNGACTAVTLDSGAAITAAEDAYAALSVAAQTLVTKYDALVAARAEYDALLNSNEGATMIAGVVEDMIANIGEVLYNPWDATTDSGAAIAAAETAYAGLTDAAKALVSNYESLTAARADYDAQIVAFDKAMAYDVDVLIDAIGEVTFESRAAIEAAEAAYAALNDAQKSYVTRYDVLVAARASYDTYGPIMNVENLANAIGSDFFQGYYDYRQFTSTNGYADVKLTDANCTTDFELTFDFTYTEANLHESDDSGIALFRSDATYAGYNFAAGGFMIGRGGAFYSGNKTPEILALTPYELIAGKTYTMTIKFEGNQASVYLDGELMVTANGGAADYTFAIFYPMNVKAYFANATMTTPDGTTNNPIRWAEPITKSGIDVLAPVDIQAKIEAAEAALAALNADQLALLDDKYETAIADARAEFDTKFAEIQAAADAVEAQISAITDSASVAAAQAAFAALTPGAQTLVENYSDLVNANALIVKNMIAALGTITPASESAIAAAEAAYAALTAEEQGLVDNYDVLKAARKEVNALKAAVADAMTKINMLQAGGSAIVNNADPGVVGSYSQFEDNAKLLNGSNAVAEYAFSFDIYVDRLNDTANAYIGGSSANEVFVGYDFVRGTVFVANAGPWGYSSDIAAESIVAEADFALELQKWYDFKFVMGDTTAKIYVDGELVLETAITEPNGWFIYYPKNNVSYYDNVEFWYNGEKQTSMADFASVKAGNWTAMTSGDPGYYLSAVAPVGPVDKDADLIAVARAAYDAVPEKAQYAVANYAVLVEAETPDVPVDPDADAKAAAAEIDALIEAIGEVTVDSADAIAAARAAVDAADANVIKFVTKIADLEAAEVALVEAQKAADKAFIYDVIAGNIEAAAPQNVVATAIDGYSINVTWDAVEGATKYWIAVDGVKIASVYDATSYVVKGLDPNTEYEITVTAGLTAEYGTPYVAGATTVTGATGTEYLYDISYTVDGNNFDISWTASDAVESVWIAVKAPNSVYGDYEFIFNSTEDAFNYAKAYKFGADYTVEVRVIIDGVIYAYEA